jgi:hypothetical protein
MQPECTYTERDAYVLTLAAFAAAAGGHGRQTFHILDLQLVVVLPIQKIIEITKRSLLQCPVRNEFDAILFFSECN